MEEKKVIKIDSGFDPVQCPQTEDLATNCYNIDRDAECIAYNLGMDLVVPKNNQLQLDIDTEEAYKKFQDKLTMMYYVGFAPSEISENPSKSGLPNRHITVSFPEEMDVWKRIALQFFFQSDPIREGLACLRVLINNPHPIVFFEKKEETE